MGSCVPLDISHSFHTLPYFSSIMRCPRLTLYFLCSSPGISQSSKEPTFIFGEWYLEDEDLGTGWTPCCCSIIDSRPSQWAAYILTQLHTLFIYIYVHIHKSAYTFKSEFILVSLTPVQHQRSLQPSFFPHFYVCVYIQVALSLHCCAQAFSGCGEWASCCIAQALGMWASGVAACGSCSRGSVAAVHGLSCSMACGMFWTRD